MANPFFTLGYGGPEYFCDREKETSKLIEALTNGRNVALISPRRMGKTGLIQHVFRRLTDDDSNRRCFYIDIYSTQNQQDFVKLMAAEILGKMDSLSEKVMTTITSFFKSCRPVFSIDAFTGAPTVSLDLQPHTSSASLKEIMEYMNRSKHECFVAIDEFQQILEYPDKGTEAFIRSVVQFAPNVHFVFAGSKQHLMTDIFSSPGRPFYQSTARMGLEPLKESVYYEFANRLMGESGKQLPQEIFHDVYAFAHGFTYYIQDILNRLYSSSDKVLNASSIMRIFADIKEEGEIVYKDYCDLLAKGQLRLLRAIAEDDIVAKPYDAQFLRRHNLTAPSSVKLAMTALTKNGIVAKSNEGYFIYDRYLSLWLRTTR
ncbi:MAG: ATP-binding protein [Bacteroidales bacterium]|nr:ATP-binding protein [Candidatus Sodaliphilus aphodohippi]